MLGVGAAAHRYLGEDGQQQRQDREVHANPPASVALLNVLRHGDDLGGQGAGTKHPPTEITPSCQGPELLKDRPGPHTHYHPTAWDRG